MSRILADRVLESTTSTGVGAISLAAAITGFRRFNAVCAVSDTAPYFIEAIDSLGQPTGDYEYGIGTYSGANTLTRTLVLGSSNAGAAVNFVAGSKNVGITLLADGFQTGSNANGTYQKQPGGLIQQYGQAVSGPSGIIAVTFPIPFPNELLGISVTAFVGATTPADAGGGTYTGATLTGATLVANKALACTFNYCATGR